jgi:hypothetical protein
MYRFINGNGNRADDRNEDVDFAVRGRGVLSSITSHYVEKYRDRISAHNKVLIMYRVRTVVRFPNRGKCGVISGFPRVFPRSDTNYDIFHLSKKFEILQYSRCTGEILAEILQYSRCSGKYLPKYYSTPATEGITVG